MTRRSRVMHCAQLAAAMGNRWYTVRELSEQTGTTLDTTHRLLTDLVASGHVTRRMETPAEMLERSWATPRFRGARRQLWIYHRVPGTTLQPNLKEGA